MAPAALPLAKLVGLLIKTLAKPVAKQIKNSMTKRPMTRNALIWVGQTTHAVTTRMTIWSAGYKIRSISRLEDEAALSRGADILSESFIFAVSGGIVVYEYNRSSEKEKKKEEARLQIIREDASRLQAKLNSLDKRLVALEEYAKANRKSIVLGIGVGANSRYIEPDSVVPINDDDVVKNSETMSGTINAANGDGNKFIKTKDEKDTFSELTSSSEKKTRRSWWWLWPFR